LQTLGQHHGQAALQPGEAGENERLALRGNRFGDRHEAHRQAAGGLVALGDDNPVLLAIDVARIIKMVNLIL
jgi:hypothetical protein